MIIWDEVDALHLREFLDKKGSKLLEALRMGRPGIEKTSVESAAMTGMLNQGWEDCVKKIEKLSEHPTVNQDSANYIDASKD